METKLKGVIPPIITPLTEREKLDREGLQKMVDYLIDGGVHGLFALGSTGEFAALDETIHGETVKVIVEHTAGRVPVLVGVTGVGTEQTITNLKRAQDLGADGAVISPGYYFPYTQAELLHHYDLVCRETKIPIMLYNVPVRARSPIHLETVKALAQYDQIIGIKDSSGSFNFVQELIGAAETLPNFAVFQGDEQAMGAAVLLGADGIVPGIGNLDPVRCVQLYNAAVEGDRENVNRLQREINDVCRVFSLSQGSPYGGLKAALHMLGLCEPYPAKPAASPSEEQLQEIKALLTEKGLLN